MDGGLKILVTGGTGFVGSHLCRELLEAGNRVRVLDIVKKPFLNPNYDYRNVDILDKEKLTQALEGVDFVIHLAAKHRFFGISEKEFFRTNVEGTKNVLDAMNDARVNRIIFFRFKNICQRIETFIWYFDNGDMGILFCSAITI